MDGQTDGWAMAAGKDMDTAQTGPGLSGAWATGGHEEMQRCSTGRARLWAFSVHSRDGETDAKRRDVAAQ